MQDWVPIAMTIIAVVCGLAGLGVGYTLGYRNGSVTGELRALHITMQQMRRRRDRHHHESEAGESLD